MHQHASPKSPVFPAQDQHVQDQYVALFLRQNKRAQVSIVISMVIMFFLLRSRLPVEAGFAWLALVLVVSSIRLGLTSRLVLGAAKPVAMITFLLLLNGICIALPVLTFDRYTDIERTFITIVLMALATGSSVSTSGYRGKFLWFAGVMLLPLSAAWMLIPSADVSQWATRGLGGLIVIYLIFLAGLGRDAYKVFDESCRIRFTEQALNLRLADALQSAQQASQAKTRFLAAASHDLRQPLHTIGMLVTAIALRQLDERSREIVDLLGVVSQSLSAQLDGLLDVSKLDAGIVQPQLQVVSLRELVQSHVASVALGAAQKGLQIKAHCASDLQVLSDANLLGRILHNLTGNAIKFTATGGVDVFVTKQGQRAVVEVIDTGIGIEPDQQQRVFQEFYQIDNDERDKSKGLGLGLAIVQRMCGLLDIELRLQSVPGHGSRFTLSMPLADNLPDAVTGATDTVTVSEVQLGLRVLVVDDEKDVRSGMKLLLEELGCHVELASDLPKALQVANTETVDLVIADFRLQGPDSGIDVIRKIQSMQPNVYALLVTGDTAPDRLQQAHAARIELLHKPVVLPELIHHLNLAKITHEHKQANSTD